MPQYKTPDVYVREKSLLPPSVAEVATAIPAFIGYTLKTEDAKQQSLLQQPMRITSMVEFETLFGGPFLEAFALMAKEDGTGYKVTNAEAPTFFFHQAVSHFFANGGGACWIVSIGKAEAGTSLEQEDFEKAIDKLEEVDEVTLICTPESIGLGDVAHYAVQNKSLQHAEKRMDRFAIVDVFNGTDGDIEVDAGNFRQHVSQGLQYGAAYYPYVRTTVARSYDEAAIDIQTSVTRKVKVPAGYTRMTYTGWDADATAVGDLNWVSVSDLHQYVLDGTTYRANKDRVYFTVDNATFFDAMGYTVGMDQNSRSLIRTDAEVADAIVDAPMVEQMLESPTLADFGDATYLFSAADIYNQAKDTLGKNYLVLPPSAAMAGVMAKTDSTRGVWKAPANVALAQVLEPAIVIDNTDQEGLNVDTTSGKSINAIRSFVGKGTLVWGARTLAGNDNEWRYVSVRRLFNMVEESIQKATQFSVFEPNTPFTWLKIKTMIESYLENLWRQGAFFGDTPDQAFFVNVGLGQTMTEDDINNGYLRVEVGLAAVRPAEFIVLTFSHKSLEG